MNGTALNHRPDGMNRSSLYDSQLLAAIVENSDDAILTKDLDGIITSWNRGAERLYGYSASEMLGKPLAVLIPPDRPDEETGILDRIRAGERVDHFETIRLRKDGSTVHISLTISPLRDAAGNVVGASKIARDVTDRRRAEEMQRLLLGEMQHRIKNVFALAGSLVGMSASRAETPAELASTVRTRLRALAQAHELTVPRLDDDGLQDRQIKLHALICSLVSPCFDDHKDERFAILGGNVDLAPRVVTPLALVLNELVTNAIKYGALRDDRGAITVTTKDDGETFTLVWQERHPDPVEAPSGGTGFGTTLSRIAVEQQLGGQIRRDWDEAGLTVTINAPTATISVQATEEGAAAI